MQRTRVLLDEHVVSIGNNAQTIGGVTTNYPLSYESLVESHVISDVVTPGWRKLLDAGIILNNPLSDSLQSLEYTGATQLAVYSPGNQQLLTNWPTLRQIRINNGGFWVTTGSGPSILDFSDELAYAKLLAISKIEQTPFDFSEDVLELRKTLTTLRRPLSLARDLANDFHDRYKFYSSGRHRSVAQSFARAWLEVRFAWRPIMISVENLIAEYNLNRAIRPVVERHVVTSGRIPLNIEGSFTLQHTGGGVVHYTEERNVVGSASVSAGILYEVTNPLRNWRWRYGVRDRDLVRAVYNVMPYSWVVDRFLHLDSSIRSLTSLADSSIRILAGWEKILVDSKDTGILVSGSHDTATSFSPSVGASAIILDKRKVRSPWSPGVTDAFPVFRISKMDTIPQVLDLVSLVLGKLKPGYKPGHHLI